MGLVEGDSGHVGILRLDYGRRVRGPIIQKARGRRPIPVLRACIVPNLDIALDIEPPARSEMAMLERLGLLMSPRLARAEKSGCFTGRKARPSWRDWRGNIPRTDGLVDGPSSGQAEHRLGFARNRHRSLS